MRIWRRIAWCKLATEVDIWSAENRSEDTFWTDLRGQLNWRPPRILCTVCGDGGRSHCCGRCPHRWRSYRCHGNLSCWQQPLQMGRKRKSTYFFYYSFFFLSYSSVKKNVEKNSLVTGKILLAPRSVVVVFRKALKFAKKKCILILGRTILKSQMLILPFEFHERKF